MNRKSVKYDHSNFFLMNQRKNKLATLKATLNTINIPMPNHMLVSKFSSAIFEADASET